MRHNVIYNDKDDIIKSVMSGIDNYVIIGGGLKKPMCNISVVAKIIKVVKRWKWRPTL